jgi:hypothetical protein
MEFMLAAFRRHAYISAYVDDVLWQTHKCWRHCPEDWCKSSNHLNNAIGPSKIALFQFSLLVSLIRLIALTAVSVDLELERCL